MTLPLFFFWGDCIIYTKILYLSNGNQILDTKGCDIWRANYMILTLEVHYLWYNTAKWNSKSFGI